MTFVPNAAAAIVARSKVESFLLNETHPGTKGRAKFFALFGFDPMRWHIPRDALLVHPRTNAIVATHVTAHGTTYTVRCTLVSPDGRNPCISAVWTGQPLRNRRAIATRLAYSDKSN